MKNEIEQAVEVLKNGGVILYPTDTIWGLGCDPKNDKAIEKLNQIKKRLDAKNYIVLVDSESLLNRYVKEIPEVTYDLLDCADHPMTIIYPNGQYVAKQILADDGSLGLRICKNKFCQDLIRRFKSGVISTSANISGSQAPKNYSEIANEIKDSVDYIINFDDKKKTSKASQIIKIGLRGEVSIIRK